jgi:hypothetical protein
VVCFFQFPHQNSAWFSLLPHTCHMPCPSQNTFCWAVRSFSSLFYCPPYRPQSDPKGNWYWLEREKTDQQTVHGTVFKYDWTKGRRGVWRLEEELDKVAVCRRFCSNYTASTFPRKLLKGVTELCWLLFINLMYIKLRDCSLQRFHFIYLLQYKR